MWYILEAHHPVPSRGRVFTFITGCLRASRGRCRIEGRRVTTSVFEEVIVDSVERGYEVWLDADAVTQHELSQSGAIDENHSDSDAFGVLDGA